MEYIRLFKTTEEYENYMNSGEVSFPNLSLVKPEGAEEGTIHFNPYDANTTVISNAAEFMAFANAMSNNSAAFAGKKAVLTADINLRGEKFNSIDATNAKGFVFDGQGFAVKNVDIVSYAGLESASQEAYGAGVFGIVAGFTMKNVKFENVTFDGIFEDQESLYREGYGAKWIGAAVGYARDLTMQNVAVNGYSLVPSKPLNTELYRIGGLVGFIGKSNLAGAENKSYLTSCSAKNIVINGGYSIGGLVGTIQTYAEVKNCYVENVKVVFAKQIASWPSYYPETSGYPYSTAFFLGDMSNGGNNCVINGENFVRGNNELVDETERHLSQETILAFPWSSAAFGEGFKGLIGECSKNTIINGTTYTNARA